MVLNLGFVPTKAQSGVSGGGYAPFSYSAGNSYYKSIIADSADCPGPAPFSLLTNTSHPWGGNQMITSYYTGWPSPWWSYGTFRDYSLSYEYVLGYTATDCCEEDMWGNCTDPNPLYEVQPSSGWTLRSGYSYRQTEGASGSATYVTWQFENFWVEQYIEAQGSNFDESRIMVRYRIRNTSSQTRCYGLRLLLDVNVASFDSAYFYDPVNGWRADEEAWDAPVPFDYWVVSNEMSFSGSYYIYGNIRSTDWGMTPTEPEHFSYAYWGDWDEPWGGGLWHEAWADCASQNRSNLDAAVAYWWGWAPSSRCLGPNEEDTIIQYFFAKPEPPFEFHEGFGGQARPVSTVLSAENPILRLKGELAGVRAEIYSPSGALLYKGEARPSIELGRARRGVYYLWLGRRVYKLLVR